MRYGWTCDLPLLPPNHGVCSATDRDLDAIRADGVLRVALSPDPTSWYLDDRRFRGFEYEVLRGFARSERLLMRVVPVRSRAEGLRLVRDGEVDLAGGRLVHVPDPEVASIPLGGGPPAVLQTLDALCDGEAVDELSDLAGKRVVVVDGTGALEALHALNIEASVTVLPDGTLLEEAVEVARVSADALIGHPQHIAPLLSRRDTDLVVGPTFPGSGSSIAVHSAAEDLQPAVEAWLADNEEAVERARTRYLGGPRWRAVKRISAFDELFRTQAKRIGWRWPLLASVAWQESRFNPAALSVAGAQGMMQIMPATGSDLGLVDPADPVQSVTAGATYLRQLEKRWQMRITDPRERVAFVLASYNAGIGHVEDAVDLAREHGLAGDRWEEVAPWLLALAHPEWNQHPVVRYGYCRGAEPVDYVDAILNRWTGYEALLDPAAGTPAPLL